MADTGSGPNMPTGQGYPPPPKAPPHPMDGAQQGYPGYGPRPAAGYPPQPQAYPPGYGQPYPIARPKPTSGKAIASLVCGLVGVLMAPLGALTGPVAMLMGFMSMKETAPGGSRNGRGMAIGGLVTGAFGFLVSAALVGLFVWIFSVAHDQSQRAQDAIAKEQQAQSDQDLRLIRERVQLYYMENKQSLKPGGPIVADGWEGGLFDENSPKVTGRLELYHLVREHHLQRPMHEYEMVIENDKKVRVRNRLHDRELVIVDVADSKYSIRDTGK